MIRTVIVENTKKLRKGALVRLNPNDPTIQRYSSFQDRSGKYHASRPTTSEERERWDAELSLRVQAGVEPWHDSAGEPRLAPRSVAVYLPLDGVFIVERARCRVQLGWGNPTGGMAKILDTQSGEHAYVPREMLEVIE